MRPVTGHRLMVHMGMVSAAGPALEPGNIPALVTFGDVSALHLAAEDALGLRAAVQSVSGGHLISIVPQPVSIMSMVLAVSW